MEEYMKPIKQYIINIGDYVVGETAYPDRCLSASFGGAGVAAVEIPWKDTEYKPWDYRAEYEMVDVEITEPVIDPETGEETGETTTWTEMQKRYTGVFLLEPITIPEPIIKPTQLDYIESQILYTALITGTLIDMDGDNDV